MGKKSSLKKARRSERAAPPARSVSTKLDWWIPSVLALVAFLAFARTIPYQFVYDDEFQVLRNPWIRSWSGLGQIFTSNVWQFMNPHTVSNYYRPFHMLFHMLGYGLSGLQPHAYHIINIVLHCICTVLVALVSFRLTRERWLSGAAGLIFALHSIHAESITWIAAVTDPSCAAFYFGALYCYLKDVENPEERVPLVLSLVFFFGALLSKEMAFTFPLVAASADWILRRKLRWSRYVMLAGVFAVYAAMRIHALSAFAAGVRPFHLDPASRVLSTFVIFSQYVLKLFVPRDMNAFHVFSPTESIFSLDFVFGLLVLAAFGTAGWFLRRQRVAVFLFGFCILTLIPVLNITRLGENIFADRYLYIPSLGASLILPLAAREIWKVRPKSVQWAGLRIGAISLAMLIIPYVYVLANSTLMWRDELTLYSETLKRSPNAMIMACNLGSYYHTHGDYERAKDWYQKAIEIWEKPFIKDRSNLAGAYIGVGGAYLKQGMPDKALDYFRKAYEIIPESPLALDTLGAAYIATGDLKSALEYLQRAIAINPRSERSYNNIAVVYLSQQKYDQAIVMAKKALSIFPEAGEPYLIMARAYELKGMIEQARQALITAKSVDPSKSSLVESELKLLQQVKF